MIALLLSLLFLTESKIHRTFDQSLNTIRHTGQTASPVKALPLKQFNQTLDHFDPTNKQTFIQYYIEDGSYYSDSHILFVYISGEGQMSPSFDNNFLKTLAKEYGGYLVALEHRYYGTSQPFEDWSTEHLKYLSSRQALADLADFITFIQKQNEDKDLRKVIIAGGSYSGCLAAWFRQLYPHIAIGAISSSGPVHAVEDFYEYDVALYEALDDACRTKIHEGMKEIHEEVVEDYSKVPESLGCSTLPVEDFLAGLGDSIAGNLQYNMDNGPESSQTKKWMCDLITSDDLKTNSSKEVMYYFYGEFLKHNNYTCVEFADTESLTNTSAADPSANMRQWVYQTCTEFGYYQTSPPDENTYLRSPWVNLTYSEGMCKKAFGIEAEDIKKGIEETNKYYHALDSYSTNVIFLNGGHDPWHKLGITPEVLEDDGRVDRQKWRVYEITNASHCTDLRAPQSYDTDSQIYARNLVRKSIDDWLAEKTYKKEFKTSHPIFISSTAVFSAGFIFCLVTFIICLVVICRSPSQSPKADSSKDSINSKNSDKEQKPLSAQEH